ncbi:photosystem II protein PsbQ [Leptothoe sp. PORK10 BA2]|uniref:photosystem II protein PsbQ n=1 Tax=Leptothoe sp. PORK10 BA2 TaxID=3110254 RepID=UPI002B1FD3C2|nr:photosystem II protein PsbQ [Leptothoe sp. PORK10 BA2]MEA5466315.1 photosystem II protein PsbQ [Leptothoe sp. PORK10 BA2]
MGICLVAIATLLVSCSSGGQATAPATYSAAQLSQISIYAGRIQSSKDRLPELADYIRTKNWVNIDNFIHGPLGTLREGMNRLAYQLLPEDKANLLAIADKVSVDLEAMSSAVGAYDFNGTSTAYAKFASDLSKLLNSLPTAE